MNRRIEYRQVAYILSLFLIVQFGGILLTTAFLLPAQAPITTQNLNTTISGGGPMSVLWLVLYLVIGTIVVIMISRVYHGDVILRLLEAYVIIAASFFVFFVVLITFFPQQNLLIPVSVASVLIGVAIVFAKMRFPQVRNFAAVIASIGVGMTLGYYFPFASAWLLMGIIAIYDYVAVFVTKHMITLAKAVSSRNLAFLIGSSDVEVIPKKYLSASEEKEIRKTINTREIKSPVIKRLVREGKLPVLSQVQLGAGDLGIPLMLSVSAYTTFLSFFTANMLIAGACAGLLLTMTVLRKYQVPLPAIPPLYASMNFALAIATAVTGILPITWVGIFAGVGVLTLVPMYYALTRGRS